MAGRLYVAGRPIVARRLYVTGRLYVAGQLCRADGSTWPSGPLWRDSSTCQGGSLRHGRRLDRHGCHHAPEGSAPRLVTQSPLSPARLALPRTAAFHPISLSRHDRSCPVPLSSRLFCRNPSHPATTHPNMLAGRPNPPRPARCLALTRPGTASYATTYAAPKPDKTAPGATLPNAVERNAVTFTASICGATSGMPNSLLETRTQRRRSPHRGISSTSADRSFPEAGPP